MQVSDFRRWPDRGSAADSLNPGTVRFGDGVVIGLVVRSWRYIHHHAVATDPGPWGGY